jgi:hypothetical protein
MNDIMKDITGIAMAIVGVAILFTLVNPQNKTSQVIQSASGGFATMLGAAMGNNTNQSGMYF